MQRVEAVGVASPQYQATRTPIPRIDAANQSRSYTVARCTVVSYETKPSPPETKPSPPADGDLHDSKKWGILSVGVETRTRIDARRLASDRVSNAGANRSLRSRLGGRANLAVYAGRAAPCPELTLKSASTCFRAGFYLPAAGPSLGTGCRKPSSKVSLHDFPT